jgi:hypothetical protein
MVHSAEEDHKTYQEELGKQGPTIRRLDGLCHTARHYGCGAEGLEHLDPSRRGASGCEWYYRPFRAADHRLDWQLLWSYSRAELGLTDAEFWGYTLVEVDLLAQRYRRIQERADRRAALPAWAQIEMNRDSKNRPEPFTLHEIVSWLGHGFQQEEHPPASATVPPDEDAPDVEAMKLKAHAFMELFGQNKQNGHQTP